ncbi:unnamed protein product, partial [Prorocentrum cordatum]
PRSERYVPIWNPVTHCLNYPWFMTDDDVGDIERVPADVWVYRYNNKELFGRSRNTSSRTPAPEPDDDDGVHGTGGAEAADMAGSAAEQAASDDDDASIIMSPDSAADPAAVVAAIVGDTATGSADHDGAGGAEAAGDNP